MNSNNNKLTLLISVDFGTGFASVAQRCCDLEVPMAASTASKDAVTGIASWIPTSHPSTHYPRFSMRTHLCIASAACASSAFANSNPTPSGAEIRLLGSSAQNAPTYTVTNVDNVKSKIQPAGGQDHHLSTIIDQWTLACALIDLASWVLLNGPQISQLLTICSNMEQSLSFEPTLPAPPPPPQEPREQKQHSPEPQQAVIPRSWPSSSVSSSSQCYHPEHHQYNQQ